MSIAKYVQKTIELALREGKNQCEYAMFMKGEHWCLLSIFYFILCSDLMFNHRIIIDGMCECVYICYHISFRQINR